MQQCDDDQAKYIFLINLSTPLQVMYVCLLIRLNIYKVK